MLIKGLIAIRSGSKGLKNKNIIKLGNIPLFHWSLISALKSKLINEIIVSSDSKKYLELAKIFKNVKVIKRCKSLSKDNTKISEVILNLIETNYLLNTDFLVLIQATQPFVKPKSINSAIKLAKETKCNTVITAVKHQGSHPAWSFELENSNQVKWLNPTLCEEPRQNLPISYRRAGSVYVINLKKFKKLKSIYGPDVRAIEVNEIEAMSIDTLFDFKLCEALINVNNIKHL